MSAPALRPYDEFPITRPRPSSDLYAISDRILARDVVAIVATEGPIHADLLYQRMAKLYSIDRAGSEVRRVVDRALREATRTGEVVRRVRFYWPGGVERVEPRLAGPRSADHIAPEELHDIIVMVLGDLGAAGRDDLVRAVARALGFQRTGSALTTAIGGAIDALVRGGRLREGATGLTVAS